MKINFFGNGSGFTFNHTNAYFIKDNDFVLIDCSMINLQKILNKKPYEKDVYLFITHMHDDHVSGATLLIQWFYYVYKKKLNVVVPKNLLDDIKTDFSIKGIDESIYNLYTDTNINKDWFVKSIVTKHAPELNNKCFGYVFNINDAKCIYTGDTNTLEPFNEDIKDCNELYVDVSAKYGGVHLKYEDVKEKLEEIAENKNVYIMHIDDLELMKTLTQNSKVKIAVTNL